MRRRHLAVKKHDARLSRGPGPLANAYVRRRYAILFYSLLLTMVAAPVLKTLGLNVSFLALLLGANLLAAVVPLGAGNFRRVLLGIVILAGAAQLAALRLDQLQIAEASLVAWTVVGVLAAASALRFSLRASSINSEHLYAALSAYLLAGIFFGVFYWFLEHTWPGSLVIADGGAEGGFKVVNGMYFSFITLATVGYGDIVPRSELARGCAVVEAIGGQLYIAVMVARLVSLYVSKTVLQKRP